MPGVSMNEIKARIKSVGNTMQITRAMELVATSKLRRARKNAEAAREFCRVYRRAVFPLISAARDSFAIEETAEGGDVLYIVIAGDRGLAGGFNSNIFRLVDSVSADKNEVFLCIGKKTVEYFTRTNRRLLNEGKHASEVDMQYCSEMSQAICRDFYEGKFSRAELIYTSFESMLSQTPRRRRLLPFNVDAFEGEATPFDAVTDGDIRKLAEAVIPEYIACELWNAICQSVASESAARRNAMNSANKNAEEMLDSLNLNYNRARQAVITQEITEIVSGTGVL